MNTAVDYELLAQQIEALAQADNHWLPVLSNASALLFEAMENINWAGFYVVDESTRGQETPELRLGPFQGKVACVRIPFGRGVCGTAAAENKTQLVPDVHAFPGHIACDAASRSEVVVPLHCGGILQESWISTAHYAGVSLHVTRRDSSFSFMPLSAVSAGNKT